jgi:hypothetical protein
MKEANTQKLIQLALSEAGYTFWRNTTALAYVGRIVHKDATTITLANYQVIEAGLAVGSADLIGIGANGVFAAIEVKRPKGGVVSPEQTRFIKAVLSRGGIAGVARSPEEALDLLSNKNKV